MVNPSQRGNHRRSLVIGVSIFLAFLALTLMSEWHMNRGNSRSAATSRLIKMLDKACQTYHKTWYIFPRTDHYSDSRALHLHLGSKRYVHLNFGGRPLPPPEIIEALRTKPPFVIFNRDMLDLPSDWPKITPDPPRQIIDAWGNPIRYHNPGVHNKEGFDLWSAGENGKFEAGSGIADHDDITNWGREYRSPGRGGWKSDEDQ